MLIEQRSSTALKNPDEIARKHLRAVFGKTGTGRRSGLVALLGRVAG